MNSEPTLTDEQISSYWRDGYLTIGNVIDEIELAALRKEEARFRGYPQYHLSDGKTVLPDTSTIFRNQMANHSEIVRRFFLQGKHLAIVQQLVGPTVCGMFNQFVTKLPDPNLTTAEFPWHQDNGYGNIDLKSDVTIWCALDDVDEKNGCVWIIPESHKGGLLPHAASGTSWHLSVSAPHDGIPVCLNAGHAVAFNALTLHRSLANHTSQPRRAFFVQYGDYYARAQLRGPVGYVSEPLYLICGELPHP